jgi:hypothetical protein
MRFSDEERIEAIKHVRSNEIVNIEFFKCMLGDLIGDGRDRYVFEHPFNKHEVIKIDMSDANSNTIEWNTWADVKNVTEVAKWLCPVVKMSPCGRVLIMKKADTNRPDSDYPALIPSFLDDVKRNNFGFIGKQLVCVDYDINKMNITGAKVKMVKANW